MGICIIKQQMLITICVSSQPDLKNSLAATAPKEDYFFPYLVGLTEGDGWFSITKNGKYLKFEFGIEMHIRDLLLLQHIQIKLGVGTIDIRKDGLRLRDCNISN
jgi:hypothetical protein